MTPQRPDTHVREAQSIARLHVAFADAGWTCQELSTVNDYGEDLVVRVFERYEGTRRATPWIFFVQAKSTASPEHYVRDEGRSFSYPLTRQHVESWQGFQQPVFLSLWDAKTDRTYWADVQASNCVYWTDAGHPWARIPKDNFLDQTSLPKLRDRTRACYEQLERELEGSEVLVDVLRKCGIQVQHEPQAGTALVEQADGSAQWHLFGPAANSMRVITERSGATAEQVFEAMLHYLKSIPANEQPSWLLDLKRAT